MANSEVKVIFAEGREVTLMTDSPNIENLVKVIVELRSGLDVDGVRVSCDTDGFDSIGFTEVVKEATRQFLEALKLEKEKYEQVIKTFNK